MKIQTIVIDDFYENPNDIREYALNNFSYQEHCFHPGFRTDNLNIENVKNKIESFIGSIFGKIEDIKINFQLNTSFEKSWIHKDAINTNIAGVLYLTPDAPVDSGTELFNSPDNNKNLSDKEFFRWKKQIKIGNKYNRLILFNSNIFHKSSNYFGTDRKNGRLVQLFFIKTNLDT